MIFFFICKFEFQYIIVTNLLNIFDNSIEEEGQEVEFYISFIIISKITSIFISKTKRTYSLKTLFIYSFTM